MSLRGKVAIVTGATRGIGRSIVLALAEAGAKVAFTFVSDSSSAAAQSLIEEVQHLGTSAIAIQCDIASLNAPSAIVSQTLSGFQVSQLDILVNNAGLGGNKPLESILRLDYQQLMGINVEAVIFMTQKFVEHAGKGARIVNLSSISARGGYATQTVYAASKAAVEAITRVWATELGPKYGINVNAVNPGPVDTDMYRAAGEVHLKRMEVENAKTPAAPRAGTGNDVAEIVLFLCEERSRWITGDVICANGGVLFT